MLEMLTVLLVLSNPFWSFLCSFSTAHLSYCYKKVLLNVGCLSHTVLWDNATFFNMVCYAFLLNIRCQLHWTVQQTWFKVIHVKQIKSWLLHCLLLVVSIAISGMILIVGNVKNSTTFLTCGDLPWGQCQSLMSL